MPRHQVFLVWFAGCLLTTVGRGWLAFGTDFADCTASNAVFTEQQVQFNHKVPEGLTVVAQTPIMVIGHESPTQVRLRATNMIKWAVDRR